MSERDDFSRASFDFAQGKYKRAQFDAITTDEWVALVEGYMANDRVAELENQVRDLEADVERLEAEVEILEAVDLD